MSIYKYFSGNVFDVVFEREGFCGVKCSYPKDYNDPFELFLGVDLSSRSDDLAFYRDVVQEIPQLPTTCFSRSPVISPMWAHYAQNHSGFVVEFDECELERSFENATINDIKYKNEPDPSIGDLLIMAARIKKPRYSAMLLQKAIFQAYFSKSTEWIYERECRLVDPNRYVEDVNGNQVLFIPSNCVVSIIIGNNFHDGTKSPTMDIAEAIDAKWYQLCIGKNSLQPYLRSDSNNSFVFQNERIIQADNECDQCSEPIEKGNSLCVWCSITEEDIYAAASSNPFRILDHHGRLQEYLDSFYKRK